MGLYIFIALVLLVIQICFCIKFSNIAEEKGYNGFSYGCICFFFGIIGYCMVAALPDLEMQKSISNIAQKFHLMEGQSRKSAVEKVSTTPTQPVITEKVVTSENAIIPTTCNNEIICPICSTKQPAGRTVCWSCGQKFVTE